MKSYVAIVFPTIGQAEYALEQLWKLNRDGNITVHGSLLVHRDAAGNFQTDDKRTLQGVRTVVGAGLGAIIGMLGGPAGIAAGAYAGGVAGMTADVIKGGEQDEAVDETELGLRPSEAAIVAEISEKNETMLDDTMRDLHGRIYRRTSAELRRQFFNPE